MSFLALLDRYAPGQKVRCFAIASAGGVLAGAVVAVVNKATASDETLASWKLGLGFLAVLAVMYISQRLASRYLTIAFEDVLKGLRDDLSAKLLSAPLRTVERLEHRLSQASSELIYLSAALSDWAHGVQHLAFLASLTVVVALVSIKALIIWLVAFVAGALFLRPRIQRMKDESRALGKATGALSGRLEQLFDGFVQVKLDGTIAAGITGDILDAAEDLYKQQWAVRQIGIGALSGAVLIIYLLSWGPAAFADPDGIGLGPVKGYEIVSLVEMSLGALLGLLNALPEWARTEEAARSVSKTLDMLSTELDADSAGRGRVGPEFEAISLKAARFAYTEDGASFEVGPIDLTIRRGELLLITGGNGSGKTTLMKMLLGLYALDKGSLSVDRTRITGSNVAGYRDLFTVIFSPQHLFSRLYGIEETVSKAQVDALLTRFGIGELTHYREGGFDRIDLSTGQKMRLAMVVALLEDRPVCVFDEWTANQDPEMTWYYYETLLPELIAAGKTVIAVSHDDRFFDRADHFIKMAGGRIVEERRREPANG